jgi:hypothetical protein
MENSKVSSIEVRFTDDYGQFKFMRGNRDLSDAKIKRITASVQKGLNLFRYCPIMVNENGYIIDGQHRFVVCKKLGMKIFYILVPEFTLRQIAEMNQNASKWKDKDFLNCYTDLGNDNYKSLHEFCDKYQLNIGIASSLLSEGKVRGAGRMDDVRDGLFKVNFYDFADAFMQKAMLFQSYCTAYKSRGFLQALEVLNQSDFNITELIDKLQQNKLRIEACGNHKDYLSHMEDLFNYRNSKRKRIY